MSILRTALIAGVSVAALASQASAVSVPFPTESAIFDNTSGINFQISSGAVDLSGGGGPAGRTGFFNDEGESLTQTYSNLSTGPGDFTGITQVNELAFTLKLVDVNIVGDQTVPFQVSLNGNDIGSFILTSTNSTGDTFSASFNSFTPVDGDGTFGNEFEVQLTVLAAAQLGSVAFEYALDGSHLFFNEGLPTGAAIPLPAGALLLMTGLGGLAIMRRRRASAATV
ncbi:MAG: VPLPA-CTERM sorting domain-containing protein [Pseudomonadota bacterium]